MSTVGDILLIQLIEPKKKDNVNLPRLLLPTGIRSNNTNIRKINTTIILRHSFLARSFSREKGLLASFSSACLCVYPSAW